MEYYVITEEGRKVIHGLRLEKKEDEARILGFLERAGSASLQQLSSSLNMTDSQVKSILQSLISRRWVWKNITRAASF